MVQKSVSLLPKRFIESYILEDLQKKMVFIGGPRQVGKTRFSQDLIDGFHETHPAYLNWDRAEHRKRIRTASWPQDQPLIVLDEVHKSRGWQSMVKGFYDTLKNRHQFLVTGSARLDHYRRGGDSLLGRYHYYRMHPISLVELGTSPRSIQVLLERGGFPEPLLAQSTRDLKRWQVERVERLIKIDLRDLEYVTDLNKMEMLAHALPDRVGSPLSIKNLAEDLEIAPKTCKKWIEHLESLYFCYRLLPWGAPKIKAVKKEQKIYLWDWSEIEDPGVRFENFVAAQLLHFCHFMGDVFGHRMELRYLRDIEAREVDFVVLKDRKPLFAVEAKLTAQALSDSLSYFEKRTPIPSFYQVHAMPSKARVIPHPRLQSMRIDLFMKDVVWAEYLSDF
jgi:predicted AAA+ superfamily ATPase